MLQLLGEWLPMGPEQTLKERIQSGHAFLVRITRQDFGYDPVRWHAYLRESNAGGYRWSNKHLGMPKRIAQAMSDSAWRQAVQELEGDV